MLLDKVGDVCFLQELIEDAVRLHDHQRTNSTKAVAARRNDADFIL